MYRSLSTASIIPALVLTMSLGGCGQTPSANNRMVQPDTVSRTAFTPLSAPSAVAQERQLDEQATALNMMAKGIVRSSTRNGAKIGAAVGCGIAFVSAAGAKGCVSNAVTSAVAGAVAGNRAGKKEVERRVEVVSLSAVVRNIRRTNDKLEALNASLPQTLAQQDAEMAAMTQQLFAGQITQAAHDARLAEIRAHRAALAAALTATAQDVRVANANLKAARDQGQKDLGWHIGATSKMENDIVSARSTISLL